MHKIILVINVENKKLLKLIFIISPFFLAFIAHFLYKFIPFPIFSIYFPINESIFEHTKLVFTPFIITYLIFYLIYKKQIDKKTYLSSLIISISTSLVLMLSFYYLFKLILNKEVMIFSILSLLIGTIISQIIAIICYKKRIHWSIEISIYALITITVLFLILTLNPPYLEFFYDKEKMGYGFNV